MEPLAVGIIEDQREIREGLAALIGGTPGFECTGAFRSVEEAMGPLQSRPPRVLLLDVGLPGMSGIDAIPLLKERCPGLALLMLTVYGDDDRIIQAVCAGACGYLLKKTPPAKLLECLREVAEGGAPMSPEVARRVMTLFREYRPPEKAEHHLTPHETRLLRLLVEGHNYKTAAAEIGVTVHTVSFHMRRIYEKLEVHSKSEAVAKALRHGLVR
ncbi:MAG TPA: response regulator transcription factor [Vicinamibacteria bacterium]|nr:response regulator transcription factor [Vicinamibacteria bacterium]